jgi:hypothetical protein
VRFGRIDPGDCPICGAAHCSCGGDGPILVEQLPQRDAAARASLASSLGTSAAPAGAAKASDSASPRPIGDGRDGHPFTTGTYRGSTKTRGALEAT